MSTKSPYDEWVTRCYEAGATASTIRMLEAIAHKPPEQTWEDFAASHTRSTAAIRKLRLRYQTLLHEYTREVVFKGSVPEWMRALDKKAKSGDVKALELAMKLTGELERDAPDTTIIIQHNIPRPGASPEKEEDGDA